MTVALTALAGCGETEEEPGSSGGEDRGRQARAVLEQLEGDRVASRVEELRDLEFEEAAPDVRIVSPRQTGDYVRRQAERTYPQERLEADEAFYRLTGVLPPDGSLRALLDRFGSGLLVGFYDPERPDGLQMVTNPQSSNRKRAEATLAHELVHALQDRAFDLEPKFDIEDTDRSSAVSALIEGDAAVVEAAYAQSVLGGAAPAAPPPTDIPPAVLLYVAFPYAPGAEFVAALLERADGSFDLVDRAWRERLPASTEQIPHPEKYFAGEEPREVSSDAERVLGDGWRSSGTETFGELDALAVLSTKLAVTPGAPQAAEGWDGGMREVFARGDDRAAVITTTWESEDEATEFARAYEMSLGRDRDARPSGDAFTLPGGIAAAVVAEGRDVRITLAPDARLATKVSEEA